MTLDELLSISLQRVGRCEKKGLGIQVRQRWEGWAAWIAIPRTLSKAKGFLEGSGKKGCSSKGSLKLWHKLNKYQNASTEPIVEAGQLPNQIRLKINKKKQNPGQIPQGQIHVDGLEAGQNRSKPKPQRRPGRVG